MKKFIKKRLVQLLLAGVLVVSCFAGIGNNEAEAAQNSLKVRVGFYGGPYYDIHTFSYSEMCSLADGQVYTYSGADSGGFMRVAYAWGVPLSRIVSAADVDLRSVKYFHMTTADSYGEGRTTFSVGTLLNTSRYFYPNMVKMVIPGNGDQQTIRFDEVTEEHTEGAQRVPTILAIGSTEFSRAEAVRVGESGEYASYSTGSLPQDHQYRLMYGQTGLSSVNKASNAQSNDKWVTAIDIQLAGAPNITTDKQLVSGSDGKVGSKYSIKLDVSLPDSYSYIPASVRQQLIDQVIASTTLGEYDGSVVNVVKKPDGTYEVEIIGEGNTDLNFSFTKKDYDGEKTTSTSSTSITGTGSGGGSSSGGSGNSKPTQEATSGNKPQDTNQNEQKNENPLPSDKDNTVVEENDKIVDNNTTPTEEEKEDKTVDSAITPTEEEEEDKTVDRDIIPTDEEEEDTQIGLTDEVKHEVKKEEMTSKPATQISKGKKWMAIGDVVLEEVVEQGADQAADNAPIEVEESMSVKGMAAGGSAVCLGFGFIATLITYYRRR